MKVRVSAGDAALVYGLGLAALALSYSALADLAARSGLGQWQAAVWPLVVDGLILAATRVVVTAGDDDGRRYAWRLLWSAAAVSILGNAAHLLLPAGPVHPAVATAVAVVPPVAALAVTHLAIVRARGHSPAQAPAAQEVVVEPVSAPLMVVPAPESVVEEEVPAATPRERAQQLRAQGWSNYAIADEVGKSEATVRRWLAAAS